MRDRTRSFCRITPCTCECQSAVFFARRYGIERGLFLPNVAGEVSSSCGSSSSRCTLSIVLFEGSTRYILLFPSPASVSLPLPVAGGTASIPPSCHFQIFDDSSSSVGRAPSLRSGSTSPALRIHPSATHVEHNLIFVSLRHNVRGPSASTDMQRTSQRIYSRCPLSSSALFSYHLFLRTT
jgi:hypothetical protein